MPGHAGEGRGFADRPAGVRGGRDRRDARGHGGGRAARTSARHRALVPGVEHVAVGAVLVGRAHGELVAVQLAERDHAGGAQLLHHGRVERAHVALEHPAGGGRGEIAGDEDVLVGDRDAGQRAGVAARRCARRRPAPAPA